MNFIKSHSTISEAEEMLNIAQEELCRPEEDVVHYNVCKHAYKAIEKYLTGFLNNHGVHIQNSTSIKELLNQCRKIDAKFNELDLGHLMDEDHADRLMVNLHTAMEFIKTAKQTRVLVGLS
ncbi:HEPN domain-containing protein [Cecembia rubra]|uniref:HEPN domain-containing protein n=1 Tax=Cecembia rubra TaxID=1485585 RepID=A0A2P8DWW2_9BACT|nr:HEPN domain-containing protein [Cecembia rubra]PSL01711.1 HEPN domain-containing protein [Cecembia rubra]